MIIYGTALLAFCHLAGLFLGDLLGAAIGVKTNVGGVGFWGAMYIPVVVAMAANQNVVAALKGGPVALLAAVGAVAICACCIAVLARTGRDDTAFAGVPQLDEQ
ncbi:malonate transporter subunit MadL [Burkholderia multivorans]|uniref:malonate transporter subunit MadL n=1 Tax=Burkholderia multivorans TaxID=87883 RepID=UPI0021C1FEA4|nr:malonate transporter subunit MadL [Burkholderia multivorans]